MVRPVSEDARGIIDPDAGFRRLRLSRHVPSGRVGRFVDRYWVVAWDLEEPYAQQVLARPVVNVALGYGPATVNGVTTRMTSRTLEGTGRALGVMFRPAGFRPFLGRPMSTITDRVLPAAERVRKGTAVDWAALAAELGYGDQSHLARDFSAAIGMPPDRYAKTLGEG